jgi:hypothetical protein
MNLYVCWIFVFHNGISFGDTIRLTVSRKGMSNILAKRQDRWTTRFLLRGGQSNNEADSANSDSGVGAKLPDDFPSKFASEANFDAAKKAFSAGDVEALRAAVDKVRIDYCSK